MPGPRLNEHTRTLLPEHLSATSYGHCVSALIVSLRSRSCDCGMWTSWKKGGSIRLRNLASWGDSSVPSGREQLLLTRTVDEDVDAWLRVA